MIHFGFRYNLLCVKKRKGERGRKTKSGKERTTEALFEILFTFAHLLVLIVAYLLLKHVWHNSFG